MSGTNRDPWTRVPPAAYDIVTCWYPETGGVQRQNAEKKLRPALVTNVLRDEGNQLYFCRVAYGTKNLKIIHRQHLDLIVQNAEHLVQMGLPLATRFDLDNIIELPWAVEFFGCWSGRSHPRIGSLTQDYIKEYAFLMIRRRSA